MSGTTLAPRARHAAASESSSRQRARSVVALQQDEGRGEARVLGEAPHPRDLTRRHLAVVDRRDPAPRCLEHAAAPGGDRSTEREQLVVLRVGAGDRCSGHRTVRERARRGEAERAGFDALLHETRHVLDVVGSCGITGALSHHIAADRAVRELRAHIDRPSTIGEQVEVLGVGLPTPSHALPERGARDVFDTLHELDQLAVATGANRRESHATVPGDQRRRSVRRRRLEHLVPRHLPVVVRVDVDEPRCDHPAGRIDDDGSLAVERRLERRDRPSRTPTSRRCGAAPVPSSTSPPRMISSNVTTPPRAPSGPQATTMTRLTKAVAPVAEITARHYARRRRAADERPGE